MIIIIFLLLLLLGMRMRMMMRVLLIMMMTMMMLMMTTTSSSSSSSLSSSSSSSSIPTVRSIHIITILIIILIIIIHMLHCLEHLYADSGFHLGCVFFWYCVFCLQRLARDDYGIGGFSLAGPNRFCNPTTALLIIIIILIFIFILILSILIILIIPIILIFLIILIILFVLIIVVINSFLLPSFSSSSVSFIVLVSNLINIKRFAATPATPKNRVRPLPHSDFTLLIPLFDYHPTPALLAFGPPPWPQVIMANFTYWGKSRTKASLSHLQLSPFEGSLCDILPIWCQNDSSPPNLKGRIPLFSLYGAMIVGRCLAPNSARL